MNQLKIWWIASRPKTLWASIVPVVIGGAMAVADHGFHLLAFLVALVAALAIQIGTNFCNDYADFKKGADTEDRVGPLRVTQAGLVSESAILRATVLMFGLAFLLSWFLIARGGWPILVVGVLSILSGVLYTAGPKPLGYLGLGDLFVLVFFGPVAVAGTYYVQTLRLPVHVVVAGLAPGLLSVAILAVNNLRDVDGDRIVGKRTLAVRFGERFARVEYVFSVVAACAIPVVLLKVNPGHSAQLLASVTVLFALPLFRFLYRGAAGPALNQVLGQTAKLLLIYGLLFVVGCLL